MSLFKTFRGNRTDLDSVALHDGYAYFCMDDGTFHIDYLDTDGVLKRKPINAEEANALAGYDIVAGLTDDAAAIPTAKAVHDAISELTTDWTQNDETQPDYVKNRTHYSIPTDFSYSGSYTWTDGSYLLSGATETMASVANLGILTSDVLTQDTPPSIYTIGTLFGETYTGVQVGEIITSTSGPSFKFCLTATWAGTGYALSLYSSQSGGLYSYSPTISDVACVVKLNEVYIPDTIARTADVAAAEHTHNYLPLSGGTVTGVTSFTDTTASTSTTTGALTISGGLGVAGNIYGSVVYGAVWNDYAEFRETTESIEAGRVVIENGDDTLSICTERLQGGANIVSDTYGFAIGETDTCKTPIAVSGRVLVYTHEDRYSFSPGDAVCSAPNGTVSKMSREEIINYPERVIGTVSSIPEYETWGTSQVAVNGRIWVKVK